MNHFLVEIIGYVGGSLTTISFLPQAIKTIRTKNTKGLSLPMYFMFVSGVVLWVIYGYFISNFVLMIMNSITFLFASPILIKLLMHHKCEKK